jgi:glycosyltransferase involved in cell wall biosynthesis
VRVLFIATAFPRAEGDVITPWLVQTIHGLRGRGVEAEVLAPAYRGLGDQVVEGVRVHRFRYAPRAWETLTHDQTAPDRIRERPLFTALVPGYLLAGSLAAARLARAGGFALVHAFWPLPHSVLGLAAGRAAGIPLVSTFFGVELTWALGGLPGGRTALKQLIRRSTAVTAISTYTAGLIRRIDPEADPVIIPFGAAVEAKTVVQEGSAGGAFRVLFVGRLVERKGVHVLLEALARLSGDPEVQLDIVGDGPEGESLRDLADRLRIRRRVRFHGFVSSETLQAYLQCCDCLALPAVPDRKGDVEGLGVVLLEAMSFGKPVIASAAGGIPDIVEHMRSGLLVEPGDPVQLAGAIDLYRRDATLRRTLAVAGRARVEERFSWDSILDRLVPLYERLAGRVAVGQP